MSAWFEGLGGPGFLTAVVWTLLIRKSACTLGRSLRIVNYPRIVNNAFRAAG